MRDRGWKHAWGMGRHLLGSQIFDYWEDPWGDKHEHYCDGDLFTADQPTGVHPASKAGMAQWGQDVAGLRARPGLVLIPTEDHYTGGEPLARRTATRTNAQVAVLEGLAHWWLCEDPPRAAAALTSFIDSLT